MPAVNKNFEDIITFTRGSGGGITNAQGNYEWLGNDVPRFDYDPVTKAVKGLLIEEQRTNLLTYSEQYSDSAWVKTFASVRVGDIAFAGAVPTQMIESLDSIPQGHRLVQANPGRDKATTYTFSFFARGAGRSVIRAYLNGYGGNNVRSFFNLATGQVSQGLGAVLGTGSFIAASMESFGNGWWRCSLTGIPSTAGGTGFDAQITLVESAADNAEAYQGDGTSGIYIWGAQLEQGSFPTSYIPTKATFTARNSIGTYTDSTGVLRTAAANIARYDHGYVDGQWVSKGLLLEGQSTNLLLQSEAFDSSYWNGTASSGVVVQPNAIIAPDGTASADKVVMAATTGYARLSSPTGLSGSAGDIWSGSVFVKAGEISVVGLRVGRVQWDEGAIFDLANQTVSDKGSAVISTSITPVIDGWLRLSLTVRLMSTSNNQYFIIAPNNGDRVQVTGDGTSGLYIWGAQLEVGDKPTSYIKTKANFVSRASTKTYFDAQGVMRTAAVDEAAIDHGYIDGQWVSKGLSVEGQATNLLLQSEAFDQWGSLRTSVVLNAAVSPDDTSPACKVVEDTSSNTHGRFSSAASFAAGTSYTFSVVAKPAGRDNIQLLLPATAFGVDQRVRFNLLGGVSVSQGGSPTHGMQSLGSGWYRCWITAQAATTVSASAAFYLSVDTGWGYTGDGTSGLYIWGAQLEAGSQPTSYIPTTTVQVTRAADVTSSAQVTRVADSSTSSQVTRAADTVALNSLSPWFNPSEGTFVIKHSVPAGQVLLSSGANNIAVSQGMGTTFVAYDAAGSYVSQNGGTPVRGEPLSFDSSFNILKSSTATSSGWIESFKYHPIRKIAVDD